jgi:hypothetical protein
MGIDQATVRGLNVRISEHLNDHEKRLLALLVVDDDAHDPDTPQGQSALRKLADLMGRFKVTMAAIDHLPDGRFAQAFCWAHPGRAYMVAYNTEARAKHSIVVPKVSSGELTVVVKRTEWIDVTLDLIRRQRNLLPLRHPLPPEYPAHLRALVKVKRRDKWGREFYVYEETGPHDWLQAEVYDVVATEVLRRRFIEGQLADSEEVVEPDHEQWGETPDLSDWEGRPWESEYSPGYVPGEGYSPGF